MAEVIIRRDNNECKYNLVDGFVSVRDDKELEVILQTSDETITYNINVDSNYADITYIAGFIEEKIKNAFNNSYPLVISEWAVRHYIYFGNIDVEKMERFTGIRV